MQAIKSIAVAAILVASISACKKDNAAAPDAAASSAAPASAAATWTPALPAPGTYDISKMDGTAAGKTEIRADYTYTDTPVKGAVETGVVKLTDGKVCFNPAGGKPADCYVESVRAADGSFTATNAKGETVNVKPEAKK